MQVIGANSLVDRGGLGSRVPDSPAATMGIWDSNLDQPLGIHEVAVRWTPLTGVTGRSMRGAGTGPCAGRSCPVVKSSLLARDGGEIGMGGSGTGGDVEPHDLVPVNCISGHDAAAIRA